MTTPPSPTDPPTPPEGDPPAPPSGSGDPPAPPAPTPPAGNGEATLEELRKALADERDARKKLQGQIDKGKRDAMTEQERAVAEAEARGEANARKALGLERAKDKFAVLATGKIAEPAKIAARLDLRSVVKDDGEVDEGELAKVVEDVAAAAPAPPPGGRVPAGPREPAGESDWLGAGIRGQS